MPIPGRFLRPDAYFFRALAAFGVAHAPEPLVRYSPPLWGGLFALGLPTVRTRIRENLRRIHGPRSSLREQVDVLRTFAHFASSFTEGLALGTDRPRSLDLVIHGGEHIVNARSEARGMILVTAHTGAWEATAALLRRDFGVEMVVAMAREPNARARRLSDAARRRAGVRIVHVDAGDKLSVVELLSHVRRGGAVGLQLDRLPLGMRGLDVTFLGSRVRVPSGPFELARASGAPVIAVFGRRLGYFRYEVRALPAVYLSRSAGIEDLSAAAQRAAASMESFVREHPTHWFHFGGG